MDQTTDYFQIRGYRKLALKVLLQTVSDLQLPQTSEGNIALTKASLAWVNYDHRAAVTRAMDQGESVPHVGLTFFDCFCALSYSTDVSALREATLRDPRAVSAALTQALDRMNGDEAVFIDLREKTNGMHVGEFNTNFLFSGNAPVGG